MEMITEISMAAYVNRVNQKYKNDQDEVKGSSNKESEEVIQRNLYI